MNASPIDTWEGAEAYFTFADKPMVIAVILVLAVVVTLGAIIATASHESESYRDYRDS